MQIGGPALAIRTIHAFVGIPINHVVVVNFADFKVLIDRLGGITVDVPEADPLRPLRLPVQDRRPQCQKWQGWRFAKGPQHMNGERALIYSRVRVNRLDPAETDVTRGARQQAVMQAVLAKFTSLSVLLELPFDGGSLVKPLTTDMSAGQAGAVRLGQVPGVDIRLDPLPSRRRLRRRRKRLAERGQSRDDCDVPRCFGAAAAHEHVRPGLRRGAGAAVGSTSWGSSRFSSSG